MTSAGLDDTVVGDTDAAPGGANPDDPIRWDRGREIARGGMGRIVEARDRRLGRPVAIKELLTQDPGLVARFEREAQLTARLQHPAIVPVYEAGRSADGEPYLAMKKVEGRDLERVIADTQQLAERLALMPNVLAVADAMAYAHGQGVIHRDLKPKNVLVGAFGETVVIDWGLAKEIGERDAPGDSTVLSAGETVAGSVMGTPAYMPPEQAAGEPVDARADVYSLGALLYHVLAGRAPYAGELTGEVLEHVLRIGPRPLEEVADGVPVDLLAIVTKAMARDPAGRYATARELADDLRRFQTGQLVGVHRYTATQLLRRWLRRYRVAFTVGVVAAAVLAVVAVLAVRRILREQRRSEAERVLAEQHRADAEELMRFMLVDLRGQLQPIGKLPLLEAPATKAVEYYEQRSASGRPVDARQYAIALMNLGEVLIAQRDDDQALAVFRAARKILERLVAGDPGNLAWLRDLSIAHEKVGDALKAQHDLAAALTEYRAAMLLREQLAALDPAGGETQRDLSVGHAKIGELLSEQGDHAGALAEYRADQAIAVKLVARDPSDRRLLRDLSVSRINVGGALEAQGDLGAALIEYRAALDQRARLAAQDPSDKIAQRDLAVSHDFVGDALLAQAELPAALIEHRAALVIFARIAGEDPHNRGWQYDLATSHYNIAEVLLAQGDPTAAEAELRASLEILERLASLDPQWSVGAAEVRALIETCCAKR